MVNEKQIKESASAKNSQKKNEEEQKKVSEKKEDKKSSINKKEKDESKDESSDDHSSEEKNKNKKKEDKKEDKKKSDSESDSSDDDDKSKKGSKKNKKEKDKDKKEKEKNEKLASKLDSDNDDEEKEEKKEVKREVKEEKKEKKEEKEEKKEKEEKEEKEEEKEKDEKEEKVKKEKEKDDKKEKIVKIEKKEKEQKKPEKKNNKKEGSSDSDDSSSSSSKSEKSTKKDKKEKEKKEKKEKEKEKEKEEKEKEKEKEEKEKEKREKEKREIEKREEEEKKRNSENRPSESNINSRGGFKGPSRDRENFDRYGERYDRPGNNNRMGGNNRFNNNNNYNERDDQGNYQQKKPRKFDLNEIKILNKIVSDNIQIINEMKSAYPGFTQLECASVFKKIKLSSSQTIFEIMNQIHREISIQITLNEAENNSRNYILPIEPYEVIDPFYNNPEHIKVMKYYHVYNNSDKEKLPPYIKTILDPNYLYTNELNQRRKVVKYPDGSFNYIPIRCDMKDCKEKDWTYSHNDLEMEYHPLFYKTKFSGNNNLGLLEKTANNLLEDFRIIYNYKNPNIINLMKLLEEQKIAKTTYRDYYKNKINKFELETFKTIECTSVKSGITCSKDAHLCYFYHNLSERRRPPTLYRYTNALCPDQEYSNSGKIKKKCENGDFCNKCHSRYEYYYHKLFFGLAMTCLRPKKKGRCIYEETCYAYHPYKEPGYKKTKEEKIQEMKDEMMEKLDEEYDLLNGLIKQYKCQSCDKFNKKLIYYLIVECDHIICNKCFEKAKEKKKCKVCKNKFEPDNKEECIEMNIKESAKSIDDLMKKKYEEKIKEKEK